MLKNSSPVINLDVFNMCCQVWSKSQPLISEQTVSTISTERLLFFPSLSLCLRCVSGRISLHPSSLSLFLPSLHIYFLLCLFMHSDSLLQFEIRQLRAHLAQQDLDLAAEREAAMQIHHVWGKQGRSFQVVEGLTPGESDDEGGQRNPREPHATAGAVWVLKQTFKGLQTGS